jgi:hypothetical protein
MGEAERSWWLDADRRWRRGIPPAGWHQGDDGRWHAPDRTTEQLSVLGAPWVDRPAPPPRPAAAQLGRHLPRTGAGGAGGADHSAVLPLWMKVAVPALATIAVLAVVGVLVTAARGGDTDLPGAAPVSPELASPVPTEPSAPGAVSHPTPESAPDEEPATPPGTPTPTDGPGTAPTSTTTTSPVRQGPDPAPGAAVPSTVPVDPLAACSTGQRNLIERSNHPWSWYAARFDTDGDGVLCT